MWVGYAIKLGTVNFYYKILFQCKMWEFYFIVPSNLSSAQENSFIKNLLFHKK
ncbi:hypothetical protein LEP1GSC097_2543 [Leptospira interrogans serovar Grippotyphosa str. UI 08368]|nr:hypothetical protein LEP1GSC097_2543 [Leptospira interrogans serovar Grippotyphosa str. UI 08368]